MSSSRLREGDEVTVGILDGELPHPVLHYFGTPREAHLALELLGESRHALRKDVERADAHRLRRCSVRRLGMKLQHDRVPSNLGPARRSLVRIAPLQLETEGAVEG